jgi:hypothetical protein
MDQEVYYAMGGGGLVWLAQMIWQRVFSSEGKANDQLITQLAEETRDLRARTVTLEQGLDEERKLRRNAEDRVHALELDNVVLRAELKRHNIDVPASVLAMPPSSGGM